MIAHECDAIVTQCTLILLGERNGEFEIEIKKGHNVHLIQSPIWLLFRSHEDKRKLIYENWNSLFDRRIRSDSRSILNSNAISLLAWLYYSIRFFRRTKARRWSNIIIFWLSLNVMHSFNVRFFFHLSACFSPFVNGCLVYHFGVLSYVHFDNNRFGISLFYFEEQKKIFTLFK